MTEEQIIRESKQIGWGEIEKHIEKGRLRIIHTHGEDIVILSRFLQDIEEEIGEEEVRLAIDPLTPIIYNVQQKRHRKTISEFFNGLRRFGTSVVTLEEMEGVEMMPLYLADSVIKLQSLGYGERYDRTLRIVKYRGGKHGEGLYPFSIERGLGIVVDVTEEQINRVTPKMKYREYFEDAKRKIRQVEGELREALLNKIEALETSWTRDESPERVLQMFFRTELGREI
jgi:KaiC/GvpD/RAD55 family RecA-like ATPase